LLAGLRRRRRNDADLPAVEIGEHRGAGPHVCARRAKKRRRIKARPRQEHLRESDGHAMPVHEQAVREYDGGSVRRGMHARRSVRIAHSPRIAVRFNRNDRRERSYVRGRRALLHERREQCFVNHGAYRSSGRSCSRMIVKSCPE